MLVVITSKEEGEKIMNAPKCEICENFIYATPAKDEKGFDYHTNCLRKKRGEPIL